MKRIIATALILLCTVANADVNEWQFESWAGRSFPVKTYVPGDATADTPIVIVMHGASRDAPRYFEDWKVFGEELGLIVVVPEFARHRFRGSARYNLGFVFDPDTGRQRPEPEWTFSAIEPLFDAVVDRVGGRQTSYSIYGHSAGGQFVHRFLYYKKETRARRYIAANSGWYTLPVNDFEYPYGLTEAGISDAELPRIFAANLTLLLGREDTDKNGTNLRKTPEAERQGPHRLARGLTMYRVAKARAETLGLEFNWQLLIVKGADHDNAKMTPAAAAIAVQ